MKTSELQYIELFRQCRQMLDAGSTPVLNALRDEAMAAFERLGLPTRKVERYKYTDVPAAFAPDYGLNLQRKDIPANVQDNFRCDVPNLSTHLIYSINDVPQPSPAAASTFNTFDETSGGIFIGSLAEASRQRPELVALYYGRLTDLQDNALAALNTAFCQDGIFVYVPRNQRLQQPLQLINLLRSSVDMMVNRRLLIVLEEGAEATLLLCDHAMDTVSFLTTQVIEVHCADNAHLNLYEVEETHTKCHRFSNVFIQAGRDCTVTHNNLTIFNGLTRNTTDVVIAGENTEVTLNGCVVADKNQHVDNNTLIDHRVPNCRSHELYKYVADDAATGAFAGRILVRQDAQKTDSKMTNANLCASTEAHVYSQPMLEIYADDVKCSHGSTVGVLDTQQLFYMQQRGIPTEEARMLLKFAFVGQVIDEITLQPLRERLHYIVEKRFRGELSKCTGCALCK